MPDQHADDFSIPPPDMTEAERFLALQIRGMGNLVGARLGAIERHLETLNGSVASVTRNVAQHETRLTVLEASCSKMISAMERQAVATSMAAANQEEAKKEEANTAKELLRTFGPLIAAIAALLTAMASLISSGAIPLNGG